MFCYSWVGHSYIRFYSNQNKNLDVTAARFLKLGLAAGCLVFVSLSLTISGTNAWLLVFTIPVLCMSVFYNFNLNVNQAKQQAKQVAVAEIMRTAIGISFPLLAIFFIQPLYAMEILLLSLLLSYMSPLLYLSNKKKNAGDELMQTPAASSDIKKQIKDYGIPIAFFVSISLALTVNDRYLIAHLMDYKSAGNYAAVYDVMNKGVSFACAPVLMAFFPHIAKQFNDGDKAAAYSSIKKALLLEAVIFFAGLGGIALFGKFIFEFLLKQPITAYTMQLVYILYAGVFVWQATMLIHKPLELRLQTKYMALGVFIAFTGNIVANYFLIKQYHDVMMAAWTTLGSSLLYLFFIIFIIFAKKKADKTNGILHN